MPALNTVTLKDRATTPNNVIFLPEEIRDGIALFRTNTGVPVGDSLMNVSVRPAGKTGSRYQVKLTIYRPVVQDITVNGVTQPSVIRSTRSTLTFDFDANSNLQERKDAVGMIEEAIKASQPFLNPILTNLERPY